MLSPQEGVRISFGELSELLRDVFVSAGVNADHAAILGENCAQCERDGSENAGVDRFGQPTTDPQAILDGGALLPFGGYKGASIALMVEILAAALTGGQFAHQVDFSRHPGAETPRTGQLLIVMDPNRAHAGDAAKRIAELLGTSRAGGVTRLPGDRRFERGRQSDRDGIELDPNRLRELRAWAAAALSS